MTVFFNALVLRPPFSGVETAVADQAACFVQSPAGYRGVVCWPRALPAERLLPTPSPGRSLRRCGAPWPSRALRMLWEQLALPAVLRRGGADLLHAPAYLLPLRASCPVVLTLYDLHALDTPARCRPLNRWNYRLWLPASIRRATRIIVPSTHTRSALLRRFPDVENRVRTIPLGVRSAFVPDPSPPADAPAAPSLPDRYLLCVGNLEPRKNLATTVRALAALHQQGHRDLTLLLAGRRTQPDPGLQREIDQLRLSGSVRQLGYVHEAWIPTLYARATALVHPSLDEGFGLPPLEAMACACPVACSNAGSLPETVGDGALLFDPLDHAALTHALLRLLGDAAEKAALTLRALRHVDGYRWPNLFERIVDVYREAATAR